MWHPNCVPTSRTLPRRRSVLVEHITIDDARGPPCVFHIELLVLVRCYCIGRRAQTSTKPRARTGARTSLGHSRQQRTYTILDLKGGMYSTQVRRTTTRRNGSRTGHGHLEPTTPYRTTPALQPRTMHQNSLHPTLLGLHATGSRTGPPSCSAGAAPRGVCPTRPRCGSCARRAPRARP